MSRPPQDPSEPAEHYPAGWAPGELPTPRRDGKRGWIVGLVALAVVVAIGAVLLFTGQDSRSAAAERNSPNATPASATLRPGATPTTIVSADDTGPITVITDDETCGPWDNVQTAVAVARNAGWNERDPWKPASTWDPDQRAQFEAVADALRSGADRAVSLAAQTPHRVMRELYEAFIAYGRAYSDALPNYQPTDDFLAQTSLAALDSITHICAANRSRVASVQEPGLAPVAPPTTPPTVADPANPHRFLPQPNPTCARWTQDEAALQERTRAWSALDSNVGAAQLNREQVLVYDDVVSVLTAQADTMESAGRGSGNAVAEDFATLGALYFRAYAKAVPLIWAGDHHLAEVGFDLNELISVACQASEG